MPSDPAAGNGPSAGAAPAEQAYVEAVIEHTRRRFMFVTLVYRVLIVLAAALVVPLVIVIGDQLAPGGLPRAVVYGAGLVWMVASGACLMGVSTRTMLRRLNRLFVARYVEQRNNLPHNPLVNALLLREDRRAAHAREAAAHQAATVLHHAADPAAPVSMRRAGLLVGGALALWVAFALVTPKPILPSLERLLGVRRPAPTATSIELIRPGPEMRVYAGQPLEIELALAGRPVEKVTFAQLRSADGGRPVLVREMQPAPAGPAPRRYTLLLAGYEVTRSFDYRVSAGDAVLTGRIEVRPRPDLRRLEVALTPPAYVGLPARRAADPDLRVWAGTRATFRVLANTAIADPVFVLRGESETRTRMRVAADDPRRASLTTTLTRSGDYWIEFADRDGHPCVDPAVHRVVVRIDQPPEIAIVTPAREDTPDNVVDLTHVAQLRIRAADDVRLGAVEMVWDTGGRPARRSLLTGTPDAPRQTAVELELATSALPIEPGQTATVWFEARDNRVLLDSRSAPQTATTRKLRLIRSTPKVARADQPGAAPPAVTDTTTQQAEAGARVVRRSPGGEAGENGQSVTSSRQGDPTGGLYKPASGGGEASGDQKNGPTLVDPNQVGQDAGGSTRDGDSSGGGSAGDDPNAATQDDAAADFKQKLKKFLQEHGDEARQVRGKLTDTPKPENGVQRESRTTGGGAGGESSGSGSGPRENAQTPPESNAAGENRPESSPGATPNRQPEQGERPPATQPADGTNDTPDTSPKQAGSPPGGDQPSREPNDSAAEPEDTSSAQNPPKSAPTPPKAPGEESGSPSAEQRPSRPAPTSDKPDKASKPGSDSKPDDTGKPARDGSASADKPHQPQPGDQADRSPTNDQRKHSDESGKPADSEKNDSRQSAQPADRGSQPAGDKNNPADDQASQSPATDAEARKPRTDAEAGKPPTGDAADRSPQAGGDQHASTPDQPTSGDHTDREQPGANRLSNGAGDNEGNRVIPMGPAREPVAAPASPGAGRRPSKGEVAAEGRSELLDTLKLLERADELTEQDLAPTGWPPARRRAFIRDLKRLHESARRAGVLAQLRARVGGELGSAEVSTGAGLAGGVSFGVARRASVRDRLEQIAPPRQQRIAPELRAVLEAYYRALAAKRAAPPKHPRPGPPHR